MPAGRILMGGSLAGLAAGMLLGVPASLGLWGLDWAGTHSWVLVAAFFLPAVAALHDHLVARYFGTAPTPWGQRTLLLLAGLAALGLAAGTLGADAAWGGSVRFAGAMLLLAAGAWRMFCVQHTLPRQSVVDLARDPLTKGDDACLKHLRFAQYLLAAGLVLLALSFGPSPEAWQGYARLRLAGLHLLLAGHGLLSLYGLSHLVVPRLSGIPAIAAGAIKGELHSSLLGFVLLTAGFLTGLTGLVVAGGILVFFAAFVFMGVLGANIMKNKSRTQRVTPEFAYVPWTFAGVFWLVAGTLLGVFLTAVPAVAAKFPPSFASGLRFAHVHGLLLGGLAVLLMGYATRLVPAARGAGIAIPFARTKWSFYLINAGLLSMTGAAIAQGTASTAFQVGAWLAIGGVAAYAVTLRRPRPST